MYRIALSMLFGDRGKYLAMVIGITFAAIIMTQQPAIYLGLISRTYSYIDEMSLPDIWVMDPSVEFIEESQTLRDTELQRVRSVEGVAWAVPMHKQQVYATMPDGSRKVIEVTGLDDATLVGIPRDIIAGSIADLRQQDAIILDEVAATERMRFRGEDGKLRPVKVGDELQINDHRAVVVGIAKMRRTFTLMAMGFTTYSRSLDFTPTERRSLTYVLVKASDKQKIPQVIASIRKLGLTAYTSKEFKQVTQNYWEENTGIPVNFGISTLFGFIIGAVVAGQTFYNFVRENLRQYATLKAMGVRNAMLVKMVLVQAATVGVIGYGLGVGAAAFFGSLIGEAKLAFLLTPNVLLLCAVAISLIVLISALIAMRTVMRTEPAVVFRT